jgi:hypothetical protein
VGMSNLILIPLFVILGALVLYSVDRLLLWMERRGWIYYRKRSGSGGSGAGNALLEIQSLIEPDKKQIIEVMREDKREQAESGAPPEPGSKD